MKKILATALTMAILATPVLAMAEPGGPKGGPQGGGQRMEQRQMNDRQSAPGNERQQRQSDNRQNMNNDRQSAPGNEQQTENNERRTAPTNDQNTQRFNGNRQGGMNSQMPDNMGGQMPDNEQQGGQRRGDMRGQMPGNEQQSGQMPGDMGGQMPGEMGGQMGPKEKRIDFDALVNSGVLSQETGDSIRAYMDEHKPAEEQQGEMPAAREDGQRLGLLDELLLAEVITAQEYEAIGAAQTQDRTFDGQRPADMGNAPGRTDFDALVASGAISQDTCDAIRTYMEENRPDPLNEQTQAPGMNGEQPEDVPEMEDGLLKALLDAGIITEAEYEAIAAA